MVLGELLRLPLSEHHLSRILEIDDLPSNGIIIYFQYIFLPPYYSSYRYLPSTLSFVRRMTHHCSRLSNAGPPPMFIILPRTGVTMNKGTHFSGQSMYGQLTNVDIEKEAETVERCIHRVLTTSQGATPWCLSVRYWAAFSVKYTMPSGAR